MSGTQLLPPRGPDHFILTSAQEVHFGYAIFLQRVPDTEEHTRGWIGKSLLEMAAAFLGSDEFRFRLAPKLEAQAGSQNSFGIVPSHVASLFRPALERFCGLRPEALLTGMSGWRWALFWLCMEPEMRAIAHSISLAEGSIVKALQFHLTWDTYGSDTASGVSPDAGEALSVGDAAPPRGHVTRLDAYGLEAIIDAINSDARPSLRAHLYGRPLAPIFVERCAKEARNNGSLSVSWRCVIPFEGHLIDETIPQSIDTHLARLQRGQVREASHALALVFSEDAKPTSASLWHPINVPPEAQTLTFWAQLADLDIETMPYEARSHLAASRAHWTQSTALPRLIAFYLPQFYPFKENNDAWGEGFSEWTNVVSAPTLFQGHVSPLVPADLGFYDLRVRETRARQSELAQQYGISGFCYYFYWFSGRQVMGDVLQSMLRDGQPSLPFCLCWANENWSRRWDGSDDDVIIAQKHDAETDAAILDDLARFFDDPRYIRIDGAPLFLIYHLSLMDEPAAFVSNLRARAQTLGFPRIVLAGVLSHGEPDPVSWGCDYGVQFPPHEMGKRELNPADFNASADFAGAIYDYAAAGEAALSQKRGSKVFPGVMPRWDNSARRGQKAHLFAGSTPLRFKHWLRAAIAKSLTDNPEAPFVFINSWNEWAEGATLEPDRHFGRAYLDAVRLALAEPMTDKLAHMDTPEGPGNTQLAQLIEENRFLASWLASIAPSSAKTPLQKGFPPVCQSLPIRQAHSCDLSLVNGGEPSQFSSVKRGGVLSGKGWSIGDPAQASLYRYVVVEALEDGGAWSGPCLTPVSDNLGTHRTENTPFNFAVSTKGLPVGDYRLCLLDATSRACFKSVLVASFAVVADPV